MHSKRRKSSGSQRTWSEHDEPARWPASVAGDGSLLLAGVTVVMTLWGGACWAGMARLSAAAPVPMAGFETLLLTLLVAGLAGVCVTSVTLAIGWMPASTLARYAAVLLHPRRRRFAVFVYITPLLAYSVFALVAESMGPQSAWLAMGAATSTLPTALLWTVQSWALAAPRRTQRRRRHRATATRQRRVRSSGVAAKLG